MKMKFALLLAIITTTVVSKAQVSIIPKVGMGVNSVDFSNNSGKEKLTTGFIGGVGFEFPVKKSKVSFAPELLINSRGVEIENIGVTTSIRMNYLDMPLLAKYYITKSLFFNVGPSVNFAVNGKEKTNGVSTDINFSNRKGSTDFKRLDISFIFSLGAKIPITYGSFIADVRYNLGLRDIDNINNQTTRNRGLAISIGYAFNLGKNTK
jgi:hypothetical protein